MVVKLRVVTLFAAVTLGLFTAPLVAGAEQPGRILRIGILASVPLTDPEAVTFWGAFIQGLREFGYVEGQNITIERRAAAEGKWEEYAALAADLVRLKVDVIVAAPAPSLAAKQATRTIPIVMAGATDPVGMGLVASLAQPGGNITGLSALAPELVGKQLEILKQIAPGVSRVAVLMNPASRLTPLLLDEAKAAARSLRVHLETLEARGVNDFQRAFAAMTRKRADALLVLLDPMFYFYRTQIAALAANSHLPVVSGTREFVDAGCLVSYGVNFPDLARRAATYVDKIFKGARPTDLPVEQPRTFDLVVNMRTAKALGLTIPQTLLLKANVLE
jgi:putative tryptophan/tyrosine transport system substrate-binding protein